MDSGGDVPPFAPANAALLLTSDKGARMELQRLGIVGPGDPEGLAEWLRTHEPVKLPKGTPSVVDLLLQMRRESTR